MNDANKKEEKKSEETLNKVEVENFNNYINTQQNLLNSLNIDKESLFKSFVLFQNLLSMNNQNNFQNLQNKKEEFPSKTTQPNQENENNKNTISDKEEKLKTNSNEDNNNNNKIPINKNAYDEIPIKPCEYNFMELLEKTLAQEENSTMMTNENNNNNNLRKSKINLKKITTTKKIKDEICSNKNKLLNEYKTKEIEKIPLKNPDQEIEIIKNNTITENNFKQIKNINNEIQNKEKYLNKSARDTIIGINFNNEIDDPMTDQMISFRNKLNDMEIKIDNNNIQKEDYNIINENNNMDHEIIQQKIKELNSEMIRLKEERNKISKLKQEYEKIHNKLLNDVKQFTLKKEEFEKYRQEELNKIKAEKKKLLSENKIINNIKFQNQSYAMTIKKDKETIENLKRQIADYQFIFKQKENESKNSLKNRVIKNSKKFNESKKLNNEFEFNYYTNNDIETKLIRISDRNFNKHLNEKGGRNCSSGTGKINRKFQDYALNLQNHKIENCNSGINIFKEDIFNSKPEVNYKTTNLENNDNNSNLSLLKNNEDILDNNNISNIKNDIIFSSEINNNIIINKSIVDSDNIRSSNINLYEHSIENDKNKFDNIKNSSSNPKKITKKKLTNKTNTEDKFIRKSINSGKFNHKTSKINSDHLNKSSNKNNKNKNFKSNSMLVLLEKTNKQKNNQYSIEDTYDFKIPKKYLDTKYKLLNTLTSDGKIINLYTNNKREIIFKSGIKKEIFEDGHQIVYFINGDLKQNFPDGKTVYFFNEAQTTQTTYSDGLQVFKFNNGQIEKHYPDGNKKISFPDGTIRYIFNNGYEETYYADGRVQKVKTKIEEKNDNNLEGSNDEIISMDRGLIKNEEDLEDDDINNENINSD